MSEDLIDLAISMVEIDTGVELSLEERERMVKKISAKLKNSTNNEQ